eukprot:gene20282-biopygen13091
MRRSQCLPVVWHISPHFLVQSAWETAHPAPALAYFAKLDPCDINTDMLQYQAHKQGGVACQVAPPSMEIRARFWRGTPPVAPRLSYVLHIPPSAAPAASFGV